MIVRLKGKLAAKQENALILEVQGVSYEVFVPASVLQRIDNHIDPQGQVELITYYYLQVSPSAAFPLLIGFLSDVEKDFFQQFIKVSGIGPRAAVKALNRPISDISMAIDRGDLQFLKSLPGIGVQKAKEIVAKLQGKVGRFALIQDQNAVVSIAKVAAGSQTADLTQWQKDALGVLMQLQYKKVEALEMIQQAMERAEGIASAEDLLNEIYKQRVKR